MRWMQYMVLRHKYQIVMWDLVTRDYSNKLNGKQVLRKVKHYVRNGSIITFHDSIKAEKNMKYALPRAIEWLLEQGLKLFSGCHFCHSSGHLPMQLQKLYVA